MEKSRHPGGIIASAASATGYKGKPAIAAFSMIGLPDPHVEAVVSDQRDEVLALDGGQRCCDNAASGWSRGPQPSALRALRHRVVKVTHGDPTHPRGAAGPDNCRVPLLGLFAA